MSRSKLFLLLSNLSNSEWKELKKYVLTQMRIDSDAYSLFQFLFSNKARITNLKSDDLIRQKLFPKIKRKSFMNIQSKLFVISEKWLVNKYYDQNKIERELLLVKIYNERTLFSLADTQMRKLERLFSDSELFSLEKNYYKYQLYFYQYFSNNPIKKHNAIRLLESCINALVRDIKDKALFLEIELTNSASLNNYDFKESLDQLLELSKSPVLSNNPIILKDLLHLLKTNDKQIFEKLYQQLTSEKIEASSILQVFVFSYLFVMANKLLALEGDYFKAVYSGLITFGLKHKIILSKGEITNPNFIRLLNFYLQFKSFDETESFIEDTSQFLREVDKNDLLIYANALNKFYHNNYDGIIQEIKTISSKSFDLKVVYLMYEVFILYKDLSIDEEILLTKINNNERSVKRNKAKISVNLYKAILNAFRLLKKMIKSKYKNIEIDMSHYNPLSGRLWFKIELDKRKKVG